MISNPLPIESLMKEVVRGLSVIADIGDIPEPTTDWEGVLQERIRGQRGQAIGSLMFYWEARLTESPDDKEAQFQYEKWTFLNQHNREGYENDYGLLMDKFGRHQ